MRPEEVIAACEAGTTGHIQQRTKTGMLTVLSVLASGGTFADATRFAGVEVRTAQSWRARYQAFDQEVKRLLAHNAEKRKEATVERKRKELEDAGLVLAYDSEVPDRGTFTEFRWNYFGRPTPIHQQAAVAALEDQSNLYVFIFGPTGMGKDTMAGDYVAYESAPDRNGLRVGWFMETGPFSQRRLGRLARYLVDPAAYRVAPEKTPDGQIPTRSLIDDYGPFQWEPQMVWADGSEVHRQRWTANEMYYVRAVAPEQDPNLWATGVEGATYGSRIDLCVCSDMFTKENQKSPTERRNQYEWFDGTLDTRLDAHGRLVVIGTWLPIENNYELILDNYLEGAHVLSQTRYGPGVYTKYSNGVAVVVVKAIWRDPDTDEERSYWPERFPLSDHLLRTDGASIPVDDLSDEAVLELTAGGARRERGLRSKRQRSPIVFKAMYQQERDRDLEVTDFTDDVLDMAMDDQRSFGQLYGHEIRLLGVDPARRYGAAWVLLAVDRAERRITIADFWWGEQLGYTGIKNKLILQPVGRFDPSWLCYEDNREGSILADTEIWKAIDAAGVSIFAHTTGAERGNIDVGPGALATWMRNGSLAIPAMTAADREKAVQLRSHFKAWDSNPDRSKPGRAGHDPDDLTMATWIAWLKAAPMIDSDLKDTGIIRGVPNAIRRRYDRVTKQLEATRGKRPNPRDTLTRGNPLDMIRTFTD